MRCNLITDRDNVVGLATDVELLSDFLRKRDHVVTVVHWRDLSAPAADVNFFLEKIAARHFEAAPKSVGILNLEWLHPSWIAQLPRLTQIWAKSTAAFEWFVDNHHDQVRFTGWLSRDPFNPQIPRVRRVLHLAGASSAKNTDTVLRAYAEAHKHVEARKLEALPPLNVVSHAADLAGVIAARANGICLLGAMSRVHLDILLNTHRFHLCPSAVEGWGHYITEATACGGIVITTDASPMHEHVLPTFGRLIAPSTSTQVKLVERHEVDPQALIEALLSLNRCSNETLDGMSALARTWNRQRNEAFEISAGRLLKELEG